LGDFNVARVRENRNILFFTCGMKPIGGSRLFKKTRFLTHPALARQDAPCPKQGRSSAGWLSFHASWERYENGAGGLFNSLLEKVVGRGSSKKHQALTRRLGQ
jgi:hypothetical protein